MIRTLQEKALIPFPSNPLYGDNHATNDCGCLLPAKFCMVGLINFHIPVSKEGRKPAAGHIDLVSSQYRIPPPDIETKLGLITFFWGKGSFTDDVIGKLNDVIVCSPWLNRRACKMVGITLRDCSSVTGGGITSEEVSRTFSRVKHEFHSGTAAEKTRFQLNKDGGGESTMLVGGLANVKQVIRDALSLEASSQTLLRRFELSTLRGILMYGPPGCGKTLLARSVSRLVQNPSGQGGSNVNSGSFISLGAGDLMKAEIGTGEKILVAAFAFARNFSPSIVFLDEFEALFVQRQRAGSGKLTSVLLQCLDDKKRWRELETHAMGTVDSSIVDVLVMAATNSPWMIDPSFLRPGRFDRIVHVSLPNLSDREAIFRLHLNRMHTAIDEIALHRLSQKVSNGTSGMSGADVAGMCKRAACYALIDCLSEHALTENHFEVALQSIGQS